MDGSHDETTGSRRTNSTSVALGGGGSTQGDRRKSTLGGSGSGANLADGFAGGRASLSSTLAATSSAVANSLVRLGIMSSYFAVGLKM